MRYADSYKKLANFGKELLQKKTLDEGLPHIAKYAKDVIDARRCSIYMYDKKSDELRTVLADGIMMIAVPPEKGIVGQTFKEGKSMIVNDAYSHPNFFQGIDKETGYVTVNLITAPIFNSNREIIGVLQLLNKASDFDYEDVKFMTFFAEYVSGFLDLTAKHKKTEEE